ncbi:MAG: tetratricopeptide repeat protein [Bacteroidetes bacterium]|nr:tetratricopeptide repeat protein [Bacteroidota bacterium]
MKKYNTIFFFLLLIVFNSCGQTNEKKFDIKKVTVDPNFDYSQVKDSTKNRELAIVCILNKEYDKAITLLENELAVNPKNVSAIHLIGYCFNEIAPKKSLIYFEKATKMLPNETAHHYNYGLAYYRLEKHQKAIEEYSKVIEISPTDSLVFYNRALAYEGIKDFKSAIKDYDTDLTINGETARTYNNRGRCYMVMNEYEQALNDYNKALEIEPTKANTFSNIGILYLRLKQFDKACPYLYKATELGYDETELINRFCK